MEDVTGGERESLVPQADLAASQFSWLTYFALIPHFWWRV
jgi:hypothetical protein